MSDWAVGDLAKCVRVRLPDFPDHGNWVKGGGLEYGQIYIVEDVINWFGHIGLVVSVRSPHRTGSWAHEQFRKIKPHTPDEQDEITIRLLTGVPVETVS